MDVPNEFQAVWIFLTDNWLITILEKVAAPFMASVEGDSVSGHETAHDFAKWGSPGAQEQMKVLC